MEPRPEWLAQVEEPILEPERPIVDPHHHFWVASSYGRYLLDDLWADTGSGHRVEQTVFLDCGAEYLTDGPEALRPVGETRFVARLAAESAAAPGRTRVGAIVSHADLLRGAAAGQVLEAHLAASDLFRGIRHSAGWDRQLSGSDDGAGRYLDPVFREGFATLAPLGLSFDAWLYFHQLPDLADLARAFPETTIVVDHLGGPLGSGPYAGRRDEVFATWSANLRQLSECANVHVKLGGIAMPINGFGWHERDRPPGSEELAEADRPYILHAIDCFGPERCMFESNFPVDKISVSYAVLWNAFKRIAAGFSEDDKAALFGGTARRVYRL